VSTDEASKYADCVVVGDGEISLVEILNFLRLEISIPKIVYGEEIEDLDSLPFPAFDLLDMNQYLFRKIAVSPKLNVHPSIRFVSSRGCIHNCVFCRNSTRKTKVRYHSADYLIREIIFLKETYGVKYIYFNDDEFVENKKRLTEFTSKFVALGLNHEIVWACQVRATSIQRDTPRLLKDAGCICAFIGIESMAPKILFFLKSGSVKPNDVENALKCCHAAKLDVFGSFIYGSPNESIAEMNETWHWIMTHRHKGLTYFAFSILAPYPGSALYTYALNNHVFSQCTVDYDKINTVHNGLENIYVLDKTVSVEEFSAFLKDKYIWLWTEKQWRTHNLRGIFTPTFLRNCLKHPSIIWRIQTLTFKPKFLYKQHR
jgi:anaerobic magnesium-protoporphyrin IX monomethyl ester cyclase